MIRRPTKGQLPFYLISPNKPNPQTYVYQQDGAGDPIEITVDNSVNPFETDQRKMLQLTSLMDDFYRDHDTRPLAEFLRTLTVYEYQKISCFFRFLREKQSIRVRILPMHYYTHQLSALCRKHKVPTAADLPPNAGKYYYSIYCGFKGFIVPPMNEKTRSPAKGTPVPPSVATKQRTDNINATGSHEAMYSFERRQAFCFHKPPKGKRRKQNPR